MVPANAALNLQNNLSRKKARYSNDNTSTCNIQMYMASTYLTKRLQDREANTLCLYTHSVIENKDLESTRNILETDRKNKAKDTALDCPVIV